MKKLFNFSLLLPLVIVLGISCTKESAPYPNDPVVFESIQLRVENNSPINFLSVQVNPGSESHQFGTVNASDTSAYFSYENGGYHYGFIEVVTESFDTLIWQPIDYVGQTPLSTGNYTYILNVDTSAISNAITLEFRED